MLAQRSPAPGALAGRIRAEHELAQQALTSAVDHGVRCGLLLEQAKAGVAHGEWLPWLADNVEFSERTAQVYMRLAANAQRASHLEAATSIRAALAELVEPRETPRVEAPRVTPAEGLPRVRAVEGHRVEVERLLEARGADPRPVSRVEALVITDLLDRHLRAVGACMSDAEDLAEDFGLGEAFNARLDAAWDDLDEVRGVAEAADVWTVAAMKASLRAKRAYGEALGELRDEVAS
ncbi:MAG: DUF3102 domain-containing protein [Thermoleophilaceae bacterium]